MVLGQSASFTTATANKGGINGNTFSTPLGVTFDPSGNLWITDNGNDRVLRFPTGNLITGGMGSMEMGQINFVTATTNHFPITANSVYSPYYLAFDPSGNLWVADAGNNRVLKYPAPFYFGESASVVIGQPNFNSITANLGGENANTLSAPYGIAFAPSGSLWISDSANNRVLGFSTGNLVTNGVANVVLGEAAASRPPPPTREA